MALTQTATTSFKTQLLNGGFDFTTDTFFIALYTANANLNADTSEYTSTDEVVASGYTPGGQQLTVSVTPSSSSGIAFISFDNVSWSGAITARGALIYKAGTNGAVCVLDFGSDKTSNATFTVQFPAATNNSAIIRIA
jgi:hypothetical protein